LPARGRNAYTRLRSRAGPQSKGEVMRIYVSRWGKYFAGVLAAAALFAGGYAAGQNRFGQPKTIIHLVAVQWNPGVSEADQQRVLDGVKSVAAQVPGVKNVWVKAERLQPRDFNAAFAIEFRDRAAADAYAESPAHKAWEQEYVPLRRASISIQVSNP
jgi:Stress responsive A/B Barrel Domain